MTDGAMASEPIAGHIQPEIYTRSLPFPDALPKTFNIPRSGIISLGSASRGAITRLANCVQAAINSDEPVPASPLIEHWAGRLLGKDKQDICCILSGPRGSGKSYSALYIATRLAETMARLTGKPPEAFFTLKNCLIIDDIENVMKVMSESQKNQIFIVDDSGISINSREFQSKKSRAYIRVQTTMRTQRSAVIYTCVLRSTVDVAIRNLVDVQMNVFKSFHSGGFNILKANSLQISENLGNKEYHPRLSFDGKKIDYWVTFNPDEKLATEYDKQRELAALRIVSEPEKAKNKDGVSLAERNLIKNVQKYGQKIRTLITDNPNISATELANRTGLQYHEVRRICDYDNIPVKTRGKSC